MEIKLPTLTPLICLRCGWGSPESDHTWWPRSTKRPDHCPNCNNPYWDKPRREKKADKGKKGK
jgi:hypothetical protein